MIHSSRYNKRIIATIVIVAMMFCTPHRVAAQPSPVPPGFSFNMHEDMDRYTPYIIPSVNWLQQTPLGQQTAERSKLNFFVLHWLERNPDIDISMPEYSQKFHDIDRDFLCLFLEGWIKHVLQTQDTTTVNCSMAGLHSMLDFYESGKAAKIGRIDYLDKLAHIDSTGNLKQLFDPAPSAKNTYIYLKAPYTKHEFRHDENYFGFHYYAINLVNLRAVNFRYMLEGYYNDWIETPDGSVTYPRLSPGNYKFRIQASMYPGFANAVEQSYSFNIAKPFWQEYWFIALSVALAFLIIYLIIKQREKNLKNLAQIDRMRITFEYEHLKSQVNPHFLFNSFNTLTNLIAKDQGKAMDYTENLSSLYRNILTYHENDFVSLSDEFAILHNYIAIQNGRFGNALQVIIDIPDGIMQSKKIVPFALQMLIENAIKHNVVAASSPLVIRITANNDEITIRNIASPKLSKEKGAGLGLINIKRRYGLLTKKTISYGIYGNEFVVTLPLL